MCIGTVPSCWDLQDNNWGKYIENVKSREAEDHLSLETSPTQGWDPSGVCGTEADG